MKNEVQLFLGYDPERRVVAYKFSDEDGCVESPPLQEGEGAKKCVEAIVNALETSGILKKIKATKAQLLERAKVEFLKAGYPWEGRS